MTELARVDVELYSSLEAETGHATGFKQNGTLGVCRTRRAERGVAHSSHLCLLSGPIRCANSESPPCSCAAARAMRWCSIAGTFP